VPLNLLDYWDFGFYQLTGFSYILAAFFLPILYGSLRFTLYHLLMGSAIAYLLTDTTNEQAAVRKILHVGRWLFWFGYIGKH